MTSPLNILVVEDSVTDYLLAVRHLQKQFAGLQPRRIDRLDDFQAALAEQDWDAVISDYSLPGLAFREIVEMVQSRAPDLPLILYSGNVGEEEAVALLKLGVHDYVLKDRPGRLASALQNGMSEAKARKTQRETARELAASESRFRSLFEQAGVGVTEVDAGTGRIVRGNPKWCEMLGYTAEEMTGLSIQELTHPEERHRDQAELEQLQHGQRSVYSVEKRYLRKDGGIVWGSVTATMLRGKDVDSGHMVSIIEDITDRKLAELAVHTLEERLALTFIAAPIGILLVRMADQTLLDANPAFLHLVGKELGAIRGLGVTDGCFWNDPEEHLRAWTELQDTGRIDHFEMAFRKGDGSTGRGALSSVVVDIAGERVVMNFVVDLTEMRAAQEQERETQRELHHLQRLESLGRLAGGVSHDMNNVLAAVMVMASLLETRFGDQPEVAKYAATILNAAGRGRDLVKRLTDFARKEVKDATPLDLNTLVRQEADLLEHTLLKKVTIQIDLQDPLPPILGEASGLANALMNLCVNACDAMPDGGVLRLETRLHGDGRVEVAVQDTGEGMPPEVAARALEPFFTTKAPGLGTGLGLSIVYGTVKAHGGTVDIRSRPGEGTRISLTFPPHSSGSALAAPGPGPEPVQRRLRILVVDDDELILETVPRLLEALGHQVQLAPGGLEALGQVEGGAPLDWVILDLNMPGLSGLETLARIRALRPGLPVLVSSGFRDAASLEAIQQFAGVSTLDKPYNLEDLRKALSTQDYGICVGR